MAYIVSRDPKLTDKENCHIRYMEYLANSKASFPAPLYDVITAEWYYRWDDHRCPHDAWLESFEIRENKVHPDGKTRQIDISIKLLGAYHDGYIEYRYPKVRNYRLTQPSSDFYDVPGGNVTHGDWIADEFRISDKGSIIHEIKWGRRSSWIIEASDVIYTWTPFA